jgi:hypothetical protein
MARYAAHVLQLGPPSARLKGTKPKSKNEIPSPNVSDSKTARNRKNGSCPAVGAMLPSAGGQIMGPVRKAGIANTKVTNRTLNAWCELSSPSQQVGEGQARTAELIVEPHAHMMLKLLTGSATGLAPVS